MNAHQPERPGADTSGGQRGEAIAKQSRTLRNSIISLAVFFALVAALLLGVPGLRAAGERITDANLPLLGAGIALELLSCAGYVLLFVLVFSMLSRRTSVLLSLSELAVNSVVSVSGIAGLALGAWVLHSEGVSLERIAKRSVVIFLLTSLVNVLAVIAIGVPMWLGALPGSRRAPITLAPAALALATLVGVLVMTGWARRLLAQGALGTGRLAAAVRVIADGVVDSLALLAAHDWRVLGAVAYWLADNLVLLACLAAFGHAPPFWTVAMAYLVGMMANSLPLPGGFVAVEGGLVGMLLLFHVRPASQVIAAVIVYRAISLWVPAVIGSLAFLKLRREIGKPLPRAAPG